MKARIFLLICVTIGVASCTDSTAPVPTSQFVGIWTFQRGAGSSVEMLLSVKADSLSGNGSWFNEAMSSGDLKAAGHVIGDSVQIDLVLSASAVQGGAVVRHGTFSGRLVASNSLAGSLTYDDEPTFAASFYKIQSDPVTARLQAP